jgi:hypothetical protein
MPALAAADWLQQVKQESLQPLTTLGDLVLGHDPSVPASKQNVNT